MPLLRAIALSTLLFSVQSHWCSGQELRVRAELAQQKMVRSDCQLVPVTVSNPTDRPISLDHHFDPAAFGPLLELQFETSEFNQVVAVGQGQEEVHGSTTVAPGGQVAALLALATEEATPRGATIPIFEFAGTYAIRASVSVKEKRFYSEAQRFEVLAEPEIDWEDKEKRQVLAHIARYPLPGEADKWRKVLVSLPKESLLREAGELGLHAFHFIERPDEYRDRWIKTRAEASPLLADWVSVCVARRLYNYQNYELAFEEMERMKVDTIDTLSLKDDYEYRERLIRKRKQK